MCIYECLLCGGWKKVINYYNSCACYRILLGRYPDRTILDHDVLIFCIFVTYTQYVYTEKQVFYLNIIRRFVKCIKLVIALLALVLSRSPISCLLDNWSRAKELNLEIGSKACLFLTICINFKRRTSILENFPFCFRFLTFHFLFQELPARG